MKYILVRHGETLQNCGQDCETLDAKADLSLRGLEQTKQAVKKICALLSCTNNSAVLYYSPYRRTRLMAEMLQREVNFSQVIEEPLLSEIQCGSLEGLPMKLYKLTNPVEYEKFLRYKNEKCRFWYKFPEGESPFEVYIRIRLFLSQLQGGNVSVIISHYNTLKILELCLLHETLDWYEENPGFDNAEIHVIEDCKLFKGVFDEFNGF